MMLVVIPIKGECGSEWEICFGFHKGQIFKFHKVCNPCVQEKGLYIYFIEAVGTDKVKIGIAKDPEERLKQLQTGSSVKLRLMDSIGAYANEEKKLHLKFKDLRHSGEWFFLTKELKDYISGLRDTYF